jgi:Zn-finger nucleic acid-binding protein
MTFSICPRCHTAYRGVYVDTASIVHCPACGPVPWQARTPFLHELRERASATAAAAADGVHEPAAHWTKGPGDPAGRRRAQRALTRRVRR